MTEQPTPRSLIRACAERNSRPGPQRVALLFALWVAVIVGHVFAPIVVPAWFIKQVCIGWRRVRVNNPKVVSL